MKKITKLGVLLLFTIFITSCCEKQDATKPSQAISVETARILQQEYVHTRANPLNEILRANGTLVNADGTTSNNLEDVREVWFDIKVMKQYIAYVEKEAKEKGITGDLGLRVYYGAYPKTGGYHQPGFSTVFFMPTHRVIPNSNAAYFFPPSGDDENIDGIDGLNMGDAEIPPKGI
ncbi:MAG: hypothetical protein L3J56_02640 [Bacteroidales bacterium]|nr:hypothetical protein [Bacteroidales bacterium]